MFQIQLQIYSYFHTVLSEDVDNQRSGFVSVAFPGENVASITKLPTKKDRYRLARFILSAPVRYCAIHSCYPDTPLFRFIKAAYALGIHTSESTRFRLKFHTGKFHHSHASFLNREDLTTHHTKPRNMIV